MAETTTVAFRIDESVKKEWETAVEGPEYNSLSHLIRLAVQRELADTETANTDAQGEVSIDENSEVLQSLNRVERVVEDIQDEVNAVSRERHSEELYDLKQVLLEVLPTAPETYQPGPREPDPSTVGEKPRDMAAKIGADTSDVSDVLEELANSIGQVRSTHNFYWKAE